MNEAINSLNKEKLFLAMREDILLFFWRTTPVQVTWGSRAFLGSNVRGLTGIPKAIFQTFPSPSQDVHPVRDLNPGLF